MDRAERDQIQRWMTRLADGDRSAFQPLFDALWPLMLGFSRRLVSPPEEAEDAAQQAMLTVFRRACTFRPERDALAWVLAVTANECRRRRRAARRPGIAVEMAAISDLAAPGPSSEETLVRRDLLEAAARAVTELHPRDAESLMASLLGDVSLRPAVTPAAYRKRVERAVARLRAAWSRRHGNS